MPKTGGGSSLLGKGTLAPYLGVEMEMLKKAYIDYTRHYLSKGEMQTALSHKYFKDLDLNLVFAYDQRTYDTWDPTPDNLRSQIDSSLLQDEDASMARAKRSELVSYMLTNDGEGKTSEYFMENVVLSGCRTLIQWTEEVENKETGEKETEFHEDISSISAPFSQSFIDKLQGCTFENCYIGGPFPEIFQAYDPDGDFEYLRLKNLNLSGVKFINCKIAGKDVFENADLNGASFINCIIVDVDFSLCANSYLQLNTYLSSVASYNDAIEDDYAYALSHEAPEVPVPNRVNTYPRGTAKSPRPFIRWHETAYEDADPYDYSYKAEMSYVDFSGSYIDKCVLSGNFEVMALNLTGTRFINCNFNDTYIHHPKLSDTKFKNMDMNNVKIMNLTPNNRGHIILNNTSFSRCYLFGVDIDSYDFATNGYVDMHIGMSTISNSNFNGLDLSGDSLQNCIFNNCNFDGTNLINADFTGSSFTNCSINNFQSEIYKCPRFKACTIKNTTISTTNANNEFTDMPSCNLDTVSISDVNLTFANFSAAKLNSVQFNNCILIGATMNDASIKSTLFNNCKLRGMKFTNSEFSDTFFNNCDAKGINIKGTSVSKEMFNNCDTKGVDI